jgi:hypothetical protein
LKNKSGNTFGITSDKDLHIGPKHWLNGVYAKYAIYAIYAVSVSSEAAPYTHPPGTNARKYHTANTSGNTRGKERPAQMLKSIPHSGTI